MKKRLLLIAFIIYTMSISCACSVPKDSGVLEVSDAQEEAAAEKAADIWTLEEMSGTVYVRVDSCKVKKGPGEEYETVGTLGLLEELWVTGRVTDLNGTEWYQIAAPQILERELLPEGAYYVQAEHVKE